MVVRIHICYISRVCLRAYAATLAHHPSVIPDPHEEYSRQVNTARHYEIPIYIYIPLIGRTTPVLEHEKHPSITLKRRLISFPLTLDTYNLTSEHPPIHSPPISRSVISFRFARHKPPPRNPHFSADVRPDVGVRYRLRLVLLLLLVVVGEGGRVGLICLR